jgi:hypothetical protein
MIALLYLSDPQDRAKRAATGRLAAVRAGAEPSLLAGLEKNRKLAHESIGLRDGLRGAAIRRIAAA